MVKIRKIRAARVVFWCAQISRLTMKFKILKFLRKIKAGMVISSTYVL